MSKTYFHELNKEERDAVFESGMTVGEFMEKYSQPDWCSYPGALEGPMGCWSLMAGYVSGENYCRNCECYTGKLERTKEAA